MAGPTAIQRRLGRKLNRHKMEKLFGIQWEGRHLSWSRKADQIAAEARLDGVYVVRTSLSEETLGADAAVAAYKSLARVERALRSLKTTPLEVRPLYVYSAGQVHGHVFLCMLAYYLEWRTPTGLPVQSLRTLLEHLGAQALNYVTLAEDDQHKFPLVAQPTALQAEPFVLLDVYPDKVVSSKVAS